MSFADISHPNFWIVILEYIGMYAIAIIILNDIIAARRPSLWHILAGALVMTALFAPTLVIISQVTAVLHLLLPLIMLFVYQRIFLPARLVVQLFWPFVLILAVAVIMTLLGMSVYAVAGAIGMTPLALQITMSALALTIEAIAAAIIVKKHPFEHFRIDSTLFIGILIATMCILVFVFAFSGYAYFGVLPSFIGTTNLNSAEWRNTVSLVVAMIALTIFLFCLIILFQANRQHKVEYENHIARLEWDYMELFADASKEIHTLHHDLANHFALLSALAEKGDIAGISAYIAQTQGSISSMRALVATGNSTVDIILSNKLRRAQQTGPQGVAVDLHVLVPHSLPLSDFELASLLGNLLDNAIEATERVIKNSAGGGAFPLELSQAPIGFTIKPLGGNLLIRVENIAFKPEERHGSYATSKFADAEKEKGRHGLGLSQVRRLVEAHEGHLDLVFKPADLPSSELLPGRSSEHTPNAPIIGTFTTTVLLPLS
jgi:signal transduction histidine kinase